MAKGIHKITDVDEITRTGVCAHCGPVKVRRKTYGSGRLGWRCCQGAKKWDGGFGTRRGSGFYKSDHCERSDCKSVIEDPVQLDVHHLDGNPQNNAVSNLQTLCANCHRLVTFRGLPVV